MMSKERADAGDARTLQPRAAMQRALKLAGRGPAGNSNPQVGCVICDSRTGVVLADGWHRGAGTAHAEVDALAQAERLGVDVSGATAYVSLQPCNSIGRTGPCTQALIEAGIAHVRYAVEDPIASRAQSDAALRQAGVDVEGGLGGEEAREFLLPWLVAAERGTPFVTLKLATTLDGRIAAADGTSQWITGESARHHAHRQRAKVGAIVVGTGTALTDDPSLTARTPAGGLAATQPLRVVVGYRDVPGNARLRGPGGKLLQLRTHDVGVILTELNERGVRHVLIEGGAAVSAAFLKAGVIDEIQAYVAPVILGEGRPSVIDIGVRTLSRAPRWATHRVEQVGVDTALTLRSPQVTSGKQTQFKER